MPSLCHTSVSHLCPSWRLKSLSQALLSTKKNILTADIEMKALQTWIRLQKAGGKDARCSYGCTLGSGSVCPHVFVLPAHQAAWSFQGEAEKAKLHILVQLVPAWSMLLAGTEEIFLDCRTRIALFCCWGLQCRSFAIHETVSSRDVCLKGPSLQADPALVCSFIHRRQKQMYKLCRQKINEVSKGGIHCKWLEGRKLLSSATASESHAATTPALQFIKSQVSHMQNWCYFNTTIIAARCKLRGCKQWRCLRCAISFAEGMGDQVLGRWQESRRGAGGVSTANRSWLFHVELWSSTIIARIQENLSTAIATTY